MEIVEATSDRSKEISVLYAKCWESTYAGMLPEVKFRQAVNPEHWMKYFPFSICQSGSNAGGRKHYMAFEGKSLIGLVSFGISYANGNKGFELNGLYVHPDFQRRGVGTSLFEYFIERGTASHELKLFLWVFGKNVNAQRFCEKRGFVNSGFSRNNAEWGVNELRYSRELAPNMVS
jgi:GNAT superfamily N-acetyltransferase